MDHTEKLGQEKVLKLLLEFSIPAIVGMLVSALYNVIDRIFIGNSSGALGLAGITVGFPIIIIQMAFGGMIGIGSTSLISIKLGQRNKEDAEHIMGNSVVLLGVISLLITVSGLLFLDPILIIFGASAEVLPYARDYMSIILFGSVFASVSFGMNNFIRAEGKPGVAMATMLIGAVMNALLAPLFIFGFHWGMKGAGLATILSQAISATWIVSYFFTGRSILKIRRVNMKLDLRLIGKIVTIGLAPFSMQLASSVVTALMNNSLRTFGGDLAISGLGIVNSLVTLIILPIIAINQGAQPIIGYNFGAHKYDRVLTTLKFSILGATCISTLGFIVTRLFATPLISLFSGKDQALIELGSHMLKVILLFLPIVGFQVVGAGYFQAIGKATQSIFLSLSRQVLFLIPALLILPGFFKLDGVIASGPAADLLSAVVTGICLFFGIRTLVHNQKTVVMPELTPLTHQAEKTW